LTDGFQEASSLRAALQKASETEHAMAKATEELEETKQRLRKLETAEADLETYAAQVATLHAELASVRRLTSIFCILADNLAVAEKVTLAHRCRPTPTWIARFTIFH
jgi:chromosome segregation ATPase